jgi:hypothetical protein
MLQQFGVPSEVVASVQKGETPFSTYSRYLTPLHNKNVIGTNVAFKLGNWVSVLYFCDKHFCKTNLNEIKEFPNLKVSCAQNLLPELAAEAGVKRLKRDYKYGLSTDPSTIAWNWNSGAGAINLAILAGAKRILLLGFDMKDQDKKTHWHTEYNSATLRGTFRRFLKRYPQIAADAKAAGVEVLNVSPDSAIEVFPRVSLQDVL